MSADLQEWYFVYEITTITISIVSVICGIGVMAIAIGLFRIRPELRQVPSINLSLYIGLADALYRLSALFACWSDFMQLTQDSEGWLRTCFWIVNFSPLWFIFLTMMISTDLQLTFLHPSIDREPIQQHYLWVATLLPLIISLPALCVPHIRWVPGPSRFSYSFGTAVKNDMFVLFCYDFWIALGIAHCVVIVTLVLIKLIRGIKYIEAVHLSAPAHSRPDPVSTVGYDSSFMLESSANAPTSRHTTNHGHLNTPAHLVRKLRQSVFRIMLYPLVPLITQTLQIVSLRLPIEESRPLHLTATILCSSQGILNFLVFSVHPVVVEVSKQWWAERQAKKIIATRSHQSSSTMTAISQTVGGSSHGGGGHGAVGADGGGGASDYPMDRTKTAAVSNITMSTF
ncbi:hypothetical protein BJ085DRAFT_40403 [Dimargaris cristalligena]|uniref:G-protein coupled receptors family 1 profile domain-containing protein n=1 Tax=Dimargaris cristalligena TaxID=215637 RepID=A0A4P9ZQQ9_9FUNG|nr:hypothetical protein BJ085DRAFT_40403 [Dimargaris cristalligena]|eukprot:RKP35753.1 hypothetical protein BJ085DRAFT_40403 [Dimargaris cristalligena]